MPEIFNRESDRSSFLLQIISLSNLLRKNIDGMVLFLIIDRVVLNKNAANGEMNIFTWGIRTLILTLISNFVVWSINITLHLF